MLFRTIGALIITGSFFTAATEAVVLPISGAILHPPSLLQARFPSLHPAANPLLPLAAAPREEVDTGYLLQKIKDWREASVSHEPGMPDEAAVSVGKWNPNDVEIVIDYITELASKSEKTIRRTIARAPIRSRLGLTDEEVQKGDLNRILKQGALLHTDIELLNLEISRRLDINNMYWAFNDGRLQPRPKKLHWEFARRLIDEISPSPSEDPMARQWYIATTAYMLSIRHLPYARENIDSALKKYPSDSRILLYAGALHETLASPVSQNIQLPPGREPAFDSKEKELKQARELYNKATEEDPDFAEAHLRLGRVLGLLGSPPQAIVELRQAAALSQDRQMSYYASLYLGYELEMISRFEEARDQYERASTLYPSAQSPLLALSQLAQSNDNTDDAMQNIQSVFSLPHKDPEKDDPLWIYDLSYVRDTAELIKTMHDMFGELPR
jgi:tetratricopeptide (TPR) repeat protein